MAIERRPAARHWLAAGACAFSLAAAAAVPAVAQDPAPLPPGTPNEVVALVETTDGPQVRTFTTSSPAETSVLLDELAGTPEVIAASVNSTFEPAQADGDTPADGTAGETLGCEPALVTRPAGETLAYFDSESPTTGDEAETLGGGSKWLYDAEYGSIGACTPDQGETLIVQLQGVNTLREFDDLRSWTLQFQSPFEGQKLEVSATPSDTYDRASTFGRSRPGSPGIAVVTENLGASGEPITCDTHYGRFAVSELEFDVDGAVTALSVSFEEHCGGQDSPALRGELRLNASVPFVPEVKATDPYRSAQWALEKLDADHVWRKLGDPAKVGCADPSAADSSTPAVLDSDSRCVVIAVIDTGVDASNEDLAGAVLPGWVVGRTSNTPEDMPTDPGGHGTAVASIIAAHTDNGIGMSGLGRYSRILPVRLEGDAWSAAQVARAILLAVDEEVDVINLSLGGPGVGHELNAKGESVLKVAIDYATDRGIVVVAAAGNGGEDCPDDVDTGDPDYWHHCGNAVMYPAAFDRVVSVGASDRRDLTADFSTRNQFVDLVAPGVDIVVLNAGEPSGDGEAAGSATQAVRFASVKSEDGTSFAAPHVAAAAAIVQLYFETLASEPVDLSPWALERHLRATAVDLGEPGRQDDSGNGLLDIAAALDTVPLVEGDMPGAPTVNVPKDGITKTANTDGGAVVTFDVTVTRAGESAPSDDLTASCFPQSGERFKLEKTTVACAAFDEETGRTGFATFEVTVIGGAADGDADGDGTPDSQDPDAGAGAKTPVPNRVNAGGGPAPVGPGSAVVLFAAFAVLAAAGVARKLQR